MCDTLESLLTYFHDVEIGDDDPNDCSIFTRLRIYKHIYCLYFFVDILYGLSILNKVFQYKYVDVSTIGTFFNVEITSIHNLLLLMILSIYMFLFLMKRPVII